MLHTLANVLPLNRPLSVWLWSFPVFGGVADAFEYFDHTNKGVKRFSGCHRNSQWYVYSLIVTSVGTCWDWSSRNNLFFVCFHSVLDNPPSRFIKIRLTIRRIFDFWLYASCLSCKDVSMTSHCMLTFFVGVEIWQEYSSNFGYFCWNRRLRCKSTVFMI